MEDTPLIALCGDHRVAVPMTVTVRSIVRGAQQRIAFHIVAPDFSDAQREAVVAATNRSRGDTVTWLALDHGFAELHPGVDESRAYYFRLALPHLLPDVRRILYLDSDLLVRADIAELWQRVVASSAAVQACYDLQRYVTKRWLPVHPEYGLTEQDAYYNTGVLGMNLTRWREEKLVDRVVQFLLKHGDACPLWDQGAINALMSRQIEPLPDAWNVYSSSANHTAKIVHFCGFKKPFSAPRGLFNGEAWQLAAWQAAMQANMLYREYFEVLDETAYRGWRPKSWHNRLFALAPLDLLQRIRLRRLERARAKT